MYKVLRKLSYVFMVFFASLALFYAFLTPLADEFVLVNFFAGYGVAAISLAISFGCSRLWKFFDETLKAIQEEKDNAIAEENAKAEAIERSKAMLSRYIKNVSANHNFQ